jgi:beta-glucosidase
VDGVANGSLAESVLDARVADLLRVKTELGLFDNPYMNPAAIAQAVDTPQHRNLALLAAQKAVILLQNEPVVSVGADGTPTSAAAPVLPLDLSGGAIHRIAVVGPSADVIRLGDYSGGGVSSNFVTVLEGMASVAGGAGVAVTYQPGCQIEDMATWGPVLWPVRPRYLSRLTGAYYPSANLTGPVAFTRNDTDLWFSWYVYGPNAYVRTPIAGTPIAAANFSARWTATLTAPVSVRGGLIGVDAQGDAVRLTLDGVVVIDTWVNASAPTTVPFDFDAGVPMSLVVEYRRTPAGQGITLQWSLIGPSEDAAIASAAAAAAAADVAVVVVGENDNTVGEWRDMNHLNLTGRQQELVLAVAATGTPTVVVLLHGRSLSIPVVAASVPAIVSAWFPGQAGGLAIAQALVGAFNPAGRLPMTFPNDVGQLPAFYNFLPSARRGYVRESSAPTWAFGHGLSYTTFNYTSLTVQPAVVPVDGVVNFTVTIANIGQRDGEEVAQVRHPGRLLPHHRGNHRHPSARFCIACRHAMPRSTPMPRAPHRTTRRRATGSGSAPALA